MDKTLMQQLRNNKQVLIQMTFSWKNIELLLLFMSMFRMLKKSPE